MKDVKNSVWEPLDRTVYTEHLS